ncbi:MAG: Acetobutylicum phosphotransbutyrylase [Acidobacteria bacterium]|nr:Acetobutylicum phosphotransbutyrylase [Acidobacteriota bacterium]
MLRFFRYYLPPLILAAIILSAANDRLSSEETGQTLVSILGAFFQAALHPDAYEALNFVMRKAAHLTEYGLLAALAFRALRAEQRGWRFGWGAGALSYVIAVASADEWLQSRTLLRTGTPADVVVDACGAIVVLLVIRNRALH